MDRFHGLTLAGIPGADFLIGAFQHTSLGQGDGVGIILPVVHALEVSQRHVHVRRVVGKFRPPPGPGLHRVGDAFFFFPLLLRLVQRAKQQHQEGHVKVQRHAAELAVTLLQAAAQAAVAGFVSPLLFFIQQLRVCHQVAEHLRISR